MSQEGDEHNALSTVGLPDIALILLLLYTGTGKPLIYFSRSVLSPLTSNERL